MFDESHCGNLLLTAEFGQGEFLKNITSIFKSVFHKISSTDRNSDTFSKSDAEEYSKDFKKIILTAFYQGAAAAAQQYPGVKLIISPRDQEAAISSADEGGNIPESMMILPSSYDIRSLQFDLLRDKDLKGCKIIADKASASDAKTRTLKNHSHMHYKEVTGIADKCDESGKPRCNGKVALEEIDGMTTTDACITNIHLLDDESYWQGFSLANNKQTSDTNTIVPKLRVGFLERHVEAKGINQTVKDYFALGNRITSIRKAIVPKLDDQQLRKKLLENFKKNLSNVVKI